MQKIDFEDLPSRRTPINGTNLNLVQTNAENAINEAKEAVLNVELIAVTDTAPATCSTGDKYYNTTTDLIYTATGTNTWGSTGESAVDGIMYIVYSKKSTYAFDGQTLISVGGGSGAYIGTTQPPQDDNSNVWINPNESVNVYGNYISNSYGTSQEIGYSQEYSNKAFRGILLYNNANGSNTDITLNDNASNYDLIEIIYKSADNIYNSLKVAQPNGKTFVTGAWWVASNGQNLKASKWTCSGTSITFKAGIEGELASLSVNYSASGIYIIAVIGYKTGLFS